MPDITVPYKEIVTLNDFDQFEEEPLPTVLNLYRGWKLVEVSEKEPVPIEYLQRLIMPIEYEQSKNIRTILVKNFDVTGANLNECNNSLDVATVREESRWITIALRLTRPQPFWTHRLTLRKDPGSENPNKYTASAGGAGYDRYFRPLGINEFETAYREVDSDKFTAYTEFLLDLAEHYSGKHNKILVAVDVYNESLKAQRYDTKMVLIVSALEALFSHTNKGVTQQLATAIPVFLQKPAGERIMYSKALEEVYDVRSRIIHGEKHKPEFYRSQLRQGQVMSLAYTAFLHSFQRIVFDNKAELFNKPKLREAYRNLQLRLPSGLE